MLWTSSLLHPSVSSADVVKPPAPRSSRRSVNGDRARAIPVAQWPGDVNDAVVVVALVVLCRSVRIQNQAWAAALDDGAGIELNRGRSVVARNIGRGRRESRLRGVRHVDR